MNRKTDSSDELGNPERMDEKEGASGRGTALILPLLVTALSSSRSLSLESAQLPHRWQRSHVLG